jgi:hypothetical protein
MEQADLKSEEADLTRATREYGLFAVVQLSVMALFVTKLHS